VRRGCQHPLCLEEVRGEKSCKLEESLKGDEKKKGEKGARRNKMKSDEKGHSYGVPKKKKNKRERNSIDMQKKRRKVD